MRGIEVGDLVHAHSRGRDGVRNRYAIVTKIESDRVWGVWEDTEGLAKGEVSGLQSYWLFTDASFTILSKVYGKKHQIKKWEKTTMKKCISDVFEKTQDALLVEKHLGHELDKDNFITKLFVMDKSVVILEEVKRREEKEKENRSVV